MFIPTPMLKTKGLIFELDDIPPTWVYEHYLSLKEKLSGQRVMVLSPFNANDKKPSFCLYTTDSSGRYRYNDFSTGLSGDQVEFVKEKFKLASRGEAYNKIIDDYRKWSLNNSYEATEFKPREPYKVTGHTKRGWNMMDKRYWTEYNIDSAILEKYNVAPLESYIMSKEENGETKTLVISNREHMYGYFRNDGTLYKIYQPYVKDMKFIKIRNYIQGTEQLTYQKKYLIIVSSLKDLMALMKLGYNNIEAVAPDSENSVIGPHIISSYKQKYKGICTLFDNDPAGFLAASKYHNNYGINGIKLDLSKDLSDSIKAHSAHVVRVVLTPLLKQALL